MRKPCLIITAFLLIALLPYPALGLIYEQCPDHAELCNRNNHCEESYYYYNYRDILCNDHSTFSLGNNQYLLVNWSESVPFQDSERDSGTVDVSSAVISVVLGVYTQTGVSGVDIEREYASLELRDCDGGGFVPIEPSHIEVSGLYYHRVSIQWNITQEFKSCSESLDVKLTKGSEEDIINLNITELSVEYDLVSAPVLIIDITQPEEDLEIGRYDSFMVEAIAECGGDCGEIGMALQYREPGGTFMNVEGSDSHPIYTTSSNPYPCGSLHDSECPLEWRVHASETGEYEFRVIASSGTLGAESDSFFVDVVVGELSVQNMYIYPNPIELGQSTMLSSEIYCHEYYCGEVRVYAKNGVSKITSTDPYITTDDTNPLIFFIEPGDPVDVSWELTPQVSGEFPDIYVSADPVDGDVGSAEGYPPVNLFVSEPSPEYGDLSIDGPGLHPLTITEGGYSDLTGTILCSGGDCGEVSAHAWQSNLDIPQEGPLTTPINPVDCGQMGDGDACPLSFSLTGLEGQYPSIQIAALSNNSGVTSVSSPSFQLDIEKAVGYILLSADVNPQQINVSESTEVTSTVACSSDYCGYLTASLLFDDGSLVSSGNLSTADPNPFLCGTTSCSPGWSVTGNDAGLYELKVLVESNESMDNETDTMALYVSDPGDSPEPEFFISSVEDISRVVGNPFTVNTNVLCFGANCGDTDIYLQYQTGSQWVSLTPSTPLSVPSNLFSFPLGQGVSEEVSWDVTPSATGSFSMRVVAESVAAGASYEYFYALISPPDVIAMEVKSPGQGDTFSRGDSVSLEAYVTMNGEPVESMSPAVSFSRELSPTIALIDRGDGVYSESIDIPGESEGAYTLTFEEEGVNRDIGISVDPELQVSFSTDKDSYQTGELMSITGEVRKRGVLVDAHAELEILCEGFTDTESIEVLDGEIVYGYTLPSMSSSPCSLSLMVTDEHNNTGRAEAGISVTKSLNDVYSLVFESPADGQVLTTGDAVDITVSVTAPDGSPVEGAEVACTDVHGNYNINLSETSAGMHSAFPQAERLHDSEEWRISCRAETTDGLFGSNQRKVLVKPVISIDVLEPKETTVEVGKTLRFTVQVWSDGMPLEDANVYMMTNDEETVFLNYTANGKYEAEYYIQKGVQPTFQVFAYDRFGNFDTRNLELNPVSTTVVNWLGIGMVGAGVFLLIGLWFLYRTEPGRRLMKGPDRKSVLSNKLKDLKKEEAALEKAKESAEVEYYQRKITEKEFREMMEGYEEDLLRVKAEIEEFRDELKSLE